jgi:hypothetical protein
MLSKCFKYGYCSEVSKFELLLQRADVALFRKAQSSEHCLFRLLPAIRASTLSLRERGHPYVLPNCNRNLFKRSFIVRSLFNFI